MKIRCFLTAVLGSAFVSACGTDAVDFVECAGYPLKQTKSLIDSKEFRYLKFHKAPNFDALRRDGQFIMADSKFDFSTSYVLGLNYQTGSQNIKQHSEGCIASSSLSIKVPLIAEQKDILAKYQAFLISNGISAMEVAKISQALTSSSQYGQQADSAGYRLLYGMSEHPVRGNFFKVDVKTLSLPG